MSEVVGKAQGMEVQYVARLARLALTEAESAVFQGQLDQVVEYVRKIGELDLESVDPTSHVVMQRNILRDDEVRPGLERDVVLANAPVLAGDQFSVPKIVE